MWGEMLDTSPEATRLYFERLAQMTTSERLALMRESSLMIRKLSEASIRKEHPGVSPAEIQARLAVRLYGRKTVERVLDLLPADAE